MNIVRLFLRILNNPKGVRFAELLRVAIAFGFEEVRTTGSHHILLHRVAGAMLNLQEVGGMAKPYQVRQFLDFVETYNLQMEGDDQ